MIAGVSLFPVMNSFAKFLTSEFPLWQVTWARFSGHLLITTLVFWPRRGPALYRTKRPWLQLLRSTIFFGSNVCFIGALPFVALATASSIMFTAPLLVTALSVWFLGERVGVWRWSAVGLGLVGALVVIRPGTES
ncbi:MAG: EamA family transporter, partial [Chromatiales bacterium]|nr:EamA family transporter [Chromatiales bacterium]